MFSANAFLAPPFTPRRLIIACSSSDGILNLNSLAPEAAPNTPEAPWSATFDPNTFEGDKSLSPLTVEARSCVKYSFLENLVPPVANFGLYGDSRTINLRLPVRSVGSIIVLIVCSGASRSSKAPLVIFVPLCSANAAFSLRTGLTTTTCPFGFL